MTPRLVVGLYTLREPLGADLAGTLEGLAGTGARAVELAGLHGHGAHAFRAALDGAGLEACSAHVPACEKARAA